MHFPVWIEQEKSPLKRAQKRLRYMLCQATHFKHGRPSIRNLAKHIPYDHSSIFNAIDRGWLTSDMAKAIEGAVGRDQVRAEWLERPLDIDGVVA